MNTSGINSQGTVFIVDISGYSTLIQKVDILNGVQIVSSLLNTIIKHNKLYFTISEIEGDAILFYEEFMERIKSIGEYCPPVMNLSLKAVIHYGRNVFDDNN